MLKQVFCGRYLFFCIHWLCICWCACNPDPPFVCQEVAFQREAGWEEMFQRSLSHLKEAQILMRSCRGSRGSVPLASRFAPFTSSSGEVQWSLRLWLWRQKFDWNQIECCVWPHVNYAIHIWLNGNRLCLHADCNPLKFMFGADSISCCHDTCKPESCWQEILSRPEVCALAILFLSLLHNWDKYVITFACLGSLLFPRSTTLLHK